jgi:hypothetical protein
MISGTDHGRRKKPLSLDFQEEGGEVQKVCQSYKTFCGSGAPFTTIHFLLNLQIDQISYYYITVGWKCLQGTKHTCLLDPLESYEKK